MTLIIYSLVVFMVLMGVGIIVFSKNIVHAAYALGLSLIGIAGIYVLLMSEFLAVVQIMLYAGGVIILLVFGVMMTNRLRGEKVISESRNKYLGAIIALSIFFGLTYLISQSTVPTSETEEVDQISQIGIAFLTEHIVAFELIAFILLVALVGATYLAKMAADE